MNNKGFAISSIIYGILIIFLLLVFSTLSILVTRGDTLFRVKANALNIIKGIEDTVVTMDALVADFNTMNITNDASNYATINYNINVTSPYNYRIVNNINGNKIVYTAYNGSSVMMSLERTINNNATPLVKTYDYTKYEEEIMLEPGLHKLEVWGASGSNGKGSYSVGYLYLSERKVVYLNVGGEKKGTKEAYNNSATHIALSKGMYSSFNNDKSNVIIAAGGNGTDGYIGYNELTNKNIISTPGSCFGDTATSDCMKNGNGYIKISSLIYYTK